MSIWNSVSELQSKLLTLWFIGETIEIRTEVVFESCKNNSKVVCNENKGGMEDGTYTLGISTMWQFMFIYRLILFLSLIKALLL
jgi:hypothetical protein